MCNKKCIGGCVAKVLLIVGGLNWGIIGIGMLMNSEWNVVNMIFGSLPAVEAIIYVLVGIAAIMKIFCCRCKKCTGAQTACCGAENMDKNM